MKRILLAGLLGAVITFFWGFLSWVVLPWHNMTMPGLNQGEKVAKVLQETNNTKGVYLYPQMQENEIQIKDASVTTTTTTTGPAALIFYWPNAMDPANPTPYAVGFIINFAICLLAAYLLTMAIPSLHTFGQRVWFVTLLGVFAALATHITFWNWFDVPTDYILVSVLDTVVTWLLGGLAIAFIVKPARIY